MSPTTTSPFWHRVTAPSTVVLLSRNVVVSFRFFHPLARPHCHRLLMSTMCTIPANHCGDPSSAKFYIYTMRKCVLFLSLLFSAFLFSTLRINSTSPPPPHPSTHTNPHTYLLVAFSPALPVTARATP